MYQLIVIIVQSCFAYPKGKQLTKREIDQLTTRTKVITKSIDCDSGGKSDGDISNKKMTMKSWRRIIEGDHCPEVNSSPSNNDTSENESYQLNDKDDNGTFDRSSTSDLLTSDSILTSCPLVPRQQLVATPPAIYESVVQKNVNITVSYNPRTPFNQLRSERPNCFISSISRGGSGLNHHHARSYTFIPTPSPGSAVKTTEIKSPEEMTGVKSPSPEAWKVAIDTGNGINWTQAKPIATTTITNNNISTIIDHNNSNNRSKNRRNSNDNKIADQICQTGKNAIQSPDQSNQQQSTNQFPITNQQLDGSESIQIVTKETIL